MFIQHKTVFDIVREAEEEEKDTTASTEEDNSTTETEDTGSEESTTTDDSSESSEENTEDSDDDFSIDTNLDDSSDESGAGVEDSTSDDSSSSLDSDSAEGEEDTSEEVVKTNADIFNSLSVEEQKIKIGELKGCFSDLYSTLSDILDRANNIDKDEDLEILDRVCSNIYNLKQYVKDYIIKVFPNKSYIENDIAFNRFLSMLNSLKVVIDEIVIIRDRKLGIDRSEDDKK